MKIAILSGGLGTRLAEETEIKPKPMVEIGGQPILWHILKHYAHYGFKDGPLWEESYRWFSRAWAGVLEHLQKYCANGR